MKKYIKNQDEKDLNIDLALSICLERFKNCFNEDLKNKKEKAICLLEKEEIFLFNLTRILK